VSGNALTGLAAQLNTEAAGAGDAAKVKTLAGAVGQLAGGQLSSR
jgi:hypothetical protein